MSQVQGKWINKNDNTLEVLTGADLGKLSVKLNTTTAALEATSSGIGIKSSGVTNDMLAGSIADGKLEKSYIYADGSRAFTDDADLGGFKITNVADPVANTDAANKGYVDQVASGLDPKQACRVATTASITLSGTQTIDGVAVVAGDRVLVKDQGGGAAEVSTVAFAGATPAGLGGKSFNVSSPSVNYYVWFDLDNGSTDPAVSGRTGIEVDIATGDSDAQIAGKVQTVLEAHAAFTASLDSTNLTITNSAQGAATDIAAGDSGLTTGTTTQGVFAGKDNGIYVVASGAWTRATDFDGNPTGEVNGGEYTFITEGTSYADTGFVLVTNAPITVGTTGLVFTEFTRLGMVQAGNGLSKTSDTMNVNVDGSTLEISSDNLRVKALGIGTSQLANDSVTADKIADISGVGMSQNGTTGVLDVNYDNDTIGINGSDQLYIPNGGVDTAQLADNSVTADKIADISGVGMSQNGSTGVLDVNYDNDTIGVDGSDQLYVKDGGIDSLQLAANSVTAVKLNSDVAGAGLGLNGTTNALDVKLTANGGLEITSDALEVDVTDFINASKGLTETTNVIEVALDAAGAIGFGSGGGLKTAVDNSSIEIATNKLQVKADGITAAMLNSDTAGDGLVQDTDGSLKVNAGDGISLSSDKVIVNLESDGAIVFDSTNKGLEVKVDASTIEIATNTIQVKDAGITGAKLASSVAGAGLIQNGTTFVLDVDPGDGIQISSDKVAVKLESDGAIVIDGTNKGMEVNVDNSSIEIATNKLQVKADGIVKGMLNADVVDTSAGLAQNVDGSLKVALSSGAGLEFVTGAIGVDTDAIVDTDYALSVTSNKIRVDVNSAGAVVIDGTAKDLKVNVDNTTIEIATNALQVKNNSIDENKIANDAFGNGLAGGNGTTIGLTTLTSSWNIGATSGTTITGVPDPVNDSDVASKSWVETTIGATEEYRVQLVTVSAAQMTAKAITLDAAPAIVDDVTVTVKGGPTQFYGDDFVVSGSTLSWNGKGLDGLIEENDKVTIAYSV